MAFLIPNTVSLPLDEVVSISGALVEIERMALATSPKEI